MSSSSLICKILFQEHIFWLLVNVYLNSPHLSHLSPFKNKICLVPRILAQRSLKMEGCFTEPKMCMYVFLTVLSDGDIWWTENQGEANMEQWCGGKRSCFPRWTLGFEIKVMAGLYVYICIHIHHGLISVSVIKLCAREKCRLGCSDLLVFETIAKRKMNLKSSQGKSKLIKPKQVSGNGTEMVEW